MMQLSYYRVKLSSTKIILKFICTVWRMIYPQRRLIGRALLPTGQLGYPPCINTMDVNSTTIKLSATTIWTWYRKQSIYYTINLSILLLLYCTSIILHIKAHENSFKWQTPSHNRLGSLNKIFSLYARDTKTNSSNQQFVSRSFKKQI